MTGCRLGCYPGNCLHKHTARKEEVMLKFTAAYIRYALSSLATFGFILSFN